MQIAIIDDEPAILHSLQSTLRSLGEHNVESFTDPEDFIDWLESNSVDLTISDQRMPAVSGIEIQAFVNTKCSSCYRVIMSGYSDFLDVVDAFNSGTIQKFISKPWNKNDIVGILKDASKQNERSTSKPDQALVVEQIGPQPLFIRETALKKIEYKIQQMAGGNAPTHIQGESGSGKELAAQYSHFKSKVAGKFVSVNCANLQNELLESHLFGHKKGSFTGAISDKLGLISEADHGTLFLDEIVELSLFAQAKLLRVLQEKKYTPLGSNEENVMTARVVTAAAKPLVEAVKGGTFREDLMYRLEVMPIRLPALRERTLDIIPLLTIFMQKYSNRICDIPLPDAGLEKTFQSYQWPGNIRQLENLAAYWSSVLTNKTKVITVNDLPENFYEYEQLHSTQKPHVAAVELNSSKFSDEELMSTLKELNGNQSATARALGVTRMTIWRRLQHFNRFQ